MYLQHTHHNSAARLSKRFGEATFTPLIFDVREPPAIARAAALVRTRLHGKKLFGLVNNAGVSMAGPAALLPLDQAKQMLDTNILGTLAVSQAFIPLLGGDRSLQGKLHINTDGPRASDHEGRYLSSARVEVVLRIMQIIRSQGDACGLYWMLQHTLGGIPCFGCCCSCMHPLSACDWACHLLIASLAGVKA